MCNSALSLWKIWFFGGISNSGAAPAKYRSNFTKLVPTFQWESAASTRVSNSRVGDPCRFDINRSGASFSFPPKMPTTDCQCQCLIVHCCTLFLWYLDHHRNQNNNEKDHLVGQPTLSVVNVTISINNMSLRPAFNWTLVVWWVARSTLGTSELTRPMGMAEMG